jgi:putative endonuclease
MVGEYIAMCLYFLQFYQIIKHRFQTKTGEIDLICKRFNTLVFVEVKSRSWDYDDIICSKTQQNRMMRTAELFLLKNSRYKNFALRFDLVLIRPFSLPLVLKNFITN